MPTQKEERVVFTQAMRKTHTILVPQMAPYHFQFFVQALKTEGYKAELLLNDDYALIEQGMKYSHNDICVPAMLVIGQFIDAIKTRKDHDKIALIITQTGGGCRASNYINLLRKALKKARLDDIPVISLSAGNIESNPGFKMTTKLFLKLHESVMFGDLMMGLTNQIKPYVVSLDALKKAHQEIENLFEVYFEHRPHLFGNRYRRHAKKIIHLFNQIPVQSLGSKPKVGIVGEIYVKYSPLGNNNLEVTLEKEGVETMTPPLYDFFLYSFDSTAHDIKRYGGSKKLWLVYKALVWYIENRREKVRKIIAKSGYQRPISYRQLKKGVEGFIDVGTHSGEGWLLTAEMIDLIHHGAPNIVCTQPFGCLPNHIAGKGMFKKIKKHFPQSNIVAIDYDTSASQINQLNRINLMVSNAFKNHAVKKED